MLKVVIALVLLAHGIGHSMGLIQLYKVATVNPAWDGESWILSGVGGQSLALAVGTVLWTLALVGFVALSAVVMGWLPEAWLQPLAIASSLASLVGLLVFPVAFPVFSSVGAFLVDVAVLAAVVWYGWVPSDLAA